VTGDPDARRGVRRPRVLLLTMPFVALSRPAIGLGILKARLAEEGFAATVGYANLLFAERAGFEAYELINDRLAGVMFAGDWLFSHAVFPALDRSVFIATLKSHLGEGAECDTILALRETVEPFLDECIERFGVASYDVVGFTTTFEQNLASLALAARIKARFPDNIVVFGGANCEGVMGLELHRRFPFVDYVCSGEGDDSFPELVKRIAAGRSGAGIPGVVHRAGGESVLAAPAEGVREMDRLPDPDFDDYFAAVRASSLAGRIRPVLLIESARGCWWGAKSHCTFCGLNGSTLAFRAKSAARVYAELERQQRRYGVSQVLAVDNIMSHGYFRDLLPALAASNPGVSLFYEIKANLKREHVELLRDAGVHAIQPGIESLSSNVLRLMRKGVSALQNVQLLRLAREYGVDVSWNLLYGFPGETADDYRETAALIETIYHLRPPGAVARIRLDRFSPYFDEAAGFGLTDVQPFPIYALLYDLPPESIANLAYFFDFRYADGRDPASYVTPALEQIDRWKENRGGDLVKRYGEDPELTLVDTRPGRPRYDFPLRGLQREVYDFCEEIRSRASIDAFASARAGCPLDAGALLEQFVAYGLMLREGERYLSLAVDPRRSGGGPSAQLAAAV
jgi:ribosomal peptide maturation radical SAM protein 1